MSADGKRFLYAMDDSASYQLSTVELDPEAAGEAPVFSGIEICDLGRRSLKATLQTQPDLLGKQMVLQFFKDGRELYPMGLGAVLLDNGKSNGDSVASDGVYTDSLVSIDKAVSLPWKLRIRAERVAADGKHHGLIIEVQIRQ